MVLRRVRKSGVSGVLAVASKRPRSSWTAERAWSRARKASWVRCTCERVRREKACIRCGRCVRACPMVISPQTIVLYARNKLFTEAEKWRALDCIECGCCAFSCPSSIPLVHYLRYAKGQILAARRRQKEKEEAVKSA